MFLAVMNQELAREYNIVAPWRGKRDKYPWNISLIEPDTGLYTRFCLPACILQDGILTFNKSPSQCGQWNAKRNLDTGGLVIRLKDELHYCVLCGNINDVDAL